MDWLNSLDPTSWFGSGDTSWNNPTQSFNAGIGSSSLGLGSYSQPSNISSSLGSISNYGLGSTGGSSNNFGFGSIGGNMLDPNSGSGGGLGGLFSNADGSTNFLGIAQALKGIGGLITGFQEGRAANKELKFMKNAFNTQNQQNVKLYNTSLADRAKSRFAIEGKSDAERDEYVKNNRL